RDPPPNTQRGGPGTRPTTTAPGNIMMRACAMVPTYDNPRTVRGVVESMRSHGLDVIVIDDGSGPAGRAVCEQLAEQGLATVVHLPQNKVKGVAFKAGFERAREPGCTHVLLIDADGQRDIAPLPP